ncbi:MAG: GMC family oxidoreductase [Acidobacteria bacterium]|nr:GMC family oxidoreductase [Acidobacteriota bacterium]
MTQHYDIIIIGTGAGGGTLARALAGSSARILLVERGDFVPQEAENWDPEAVWKHLRYQTQELWLDRNGEAFRPYTHYNVGGNTKFWGAVLYRLRREDFQAVEHMEGLSPGWPVDYDTLEPYYDRAEHLYAVRGQHGIDPTEPARGPFPNENVPHSEGMEEIVGRLRGMGLHPAPLPLGIQRPGETDGCVLCNTCNSFACRVHAKSEADVVGVRPAMRDGNGRVQLWTNACARRLLTDASGRRIVAAEIERAGRVVRVEAPIVIVAAGAINSAALLLRSASDKHPNGLANSSGLVGKRYMAHLATMMQGFHPLKRNSTVFQKTVAVNDYYLRGPKTKYPLGSIQSQGRTHGVMAQTVVPWIPVRAYDWWVARGVDWLVMSEDLPSESNRVTVAPDGRIQLHYMPNNLRAHRLLVKETKRILRRLGFPFIVKHSHGARNTTHQCGTLVFGTDPATSVLDPFCRAHDIENLFVVDASFFPSSAAVNPGLTIIAQALRVADHIKSVELRIGQGASAATLDRAGRDSRRMEITT